MHLRQHQEDEDESADRRMAMRTWATVIRLAGLVVVLAVLTRGVMTSARTSRRDDNVIYSLSPSTRGQRPVSSGFSSVTPHPGPTQEGGDWIPKMNSTVILSSPAQLGIRGGHVAVGYSVFASAFSTKQRDGFSQMATGKSVSSSTKLAEREKTTNVLVTQPFTSDFSFGESHSAQLALDFTHKLSASTQRSVTKAFKHETSVTTQSQLANAFKHERSNSTQSWATTAFRQQPFVSTQGPPIHTATPEHMKFSAESLVDCVLSGGIFYLRAFSGSLTIDNSHPKTGNVSYESSQCTVVVTVPDGRIMALQPVRLQGLCSEVLLNVTNERVLGSGKVIYNQVFVGCSGHFKRGWTPGREYIYIPAGSKSHITVRHSRYTLPPSPVPPFSVEIHFSSLPGSTDLLDVDFTTPLNGKL